MTNILIVESRFYPDISDMLLKGARSALEKAGCTHSTFTVPGSLEIPGAIARAHDSGRYDGFVALGCVIRGETSHYDTVCNESARGIMDLCVRERLAIGNGILTVENRKQALFRANPAKADKGGGAAMACLSLIEIGKKE